MMSVSAWYLLKNRHTELAKANMKVALAGFILFATANFGLMGPNMAIEVTNEQPLKLASMEGLWESTSCAPLYLVGWVDEATQTTTGISIPCLLSVLAYFNPQATVQGINSMSPPDPTPPINLVFQVYHFMFGFGSLFVPIGLLAGLLYWRKAATVHGPLDAVDPRGHRVLRGGRDHRRLVDRGGRPPAVGRLQRPQDGGWGIADPGRDRRRHLPGHVHRAVRDPPRAVPVPAQPGDPAWAGAARGRRDGRPRHAARHVPRDLHAPGSRRPRAETTDARGDLVRAVRR